MKLTKLEIKGFKSFGDKITIAFDEGVTAVVGPNGCGKSNVVDAIRWVLGEQSTKALRSEKMENVIFNGSKNRKASNLAEVSLSFDNSKDVLSTEFTELTITRKLYRSGESEYRLNNVSCRLKDITDLFLDTGIGPDSYSIIELKMVEEIISNKEGSRRALFEEASGISKYKQRKKHTFNKLKDTEDDLSRVEDLLFELEKNLKTLESQAKRTERYYKLKEQYREVSIQLAYLKIKGIDQSRLALELQKQGHQDEKTALTAALDTTEAALEKIKLESLTSEKNLITQQKTVHEFSARIADYENQKKIRNEKAKNLEERSSRLRRELQTDQTALQAGEIELESLLKQIEPETSRLQQLETELPSYKIEADEFATHIHQLREDLESFQQEANELLKNLSAREKEYDHLGIRAETLRTEMSRSERDSESRETELNAMTRQLNELTSLIQSKKETLDLKTQQANTLRKEIAELEEQDKNKRDELAILNRKRDAKQNEYKLTKSLVDNLEGFPDSLRYLKKNADWLRQAPLLSDIILCKEEYKIAIENFLDPYMNYYVVNSFEEAFKAVHLLGDAEKGKANFFILDAFTEQESHSSHSRLHESGSMPSPSEVGIPALDVLEVDKRYSPLVQHLFRNVFIGRPTNVLPPEQQASSLPLSSPLIKNFGNIYIDPLGRSVQSTMHVSGGSVGLFEGKRLGRAKNLEVLLKEIEAAGKKLQQLQKEQEDIKKGLQTKREELSKVNVSQLNEEIGRLNASVYGLQAKKEQFELLLKGNLERKGDISVQLADILTHYTMLEPQIQLLKEQHQTHTNSISSKQQEIREVSHLLSLASTKFNEQNILFHQQQNRVQSLEKDLSYKRSGKEVLMARMGTNRIELEKLEIALTEMSLVPDDTDAELISLYQQKSTLDKGLREMEEEYYRSKSDISDLEQRNLELRRKREHSDALILALNEKLNQLQLDLHGLKERLSVEFSLNPEDLFVEYEESNSSFPISDAQDPAFHTEGKEGPDKQTAHENEEELKAKNEKIKHSLDTFGAINPLAMEAFKEIDERYTFIKAQKDDLLQAKKSLLETIQEIDDTAKGKFLESFNLIRENFIRVFRSLFNEEDSCDLILTEPDNLLESEIDIVARPKGKRPLTINQLSGGEKTLTATAILFSLYLLKPAPFCIFDEVDAPLDDTNIDKFNKIIRDFSADSQFIVVTHNKRTIASTDVVYGITMVEAGISRVVPVDLRNVDSSAA